MWIDSHTHVTASEFDADREATMQRARDAGVVQMIAIGAGWGIDANEAAVQLAERDDRFRTITLRPAQGSCLPRFPAGVKETMAESACKADR